MNFDMNDIVNVSEIKQEHESLIDRSNRKLSQKESISAPEMTIGQSNSAILTELFEEVDQLRNKIKLNQRQLLFLESENNRLLQEKNKLFFENKTVTEKFSIVMEKNDSLSQTFDSLTAKHELLCQKEKAMDSLLKTQSIDLQRMSKFYLKIKNVIKPFIFNLKTQVADLTAQNQSQKSTIENLQKSLSESFRKNEDLLADFENTKKSYQFEKIDMVKNYEEQLHDLARETVSIKASEDDAKIENLKLRKSLENKYTLENELIKYKRDSIEMAEKIVQLESQNVKLNNSTTIIQNEASQLKQRLIQIESLNEQKDLTVESLRSQLTQKLDELEKMNLRIKMFEKLNLNLSLASETTASVNQ
jgi:chromosome segregation ATPase